MFGLFGLFGGQHGPTTCSPDLKILEMFIVVRGNERSIVATKGAVGVKGLCFLQYYVYIYICYTICSYLYNITIRCILDECMSPACVRQIWLLLNNWTWCKKESNRFRLARGLELSVVFKLSRLTSCLFPHIDVRGFCSWCCIRSPLLSSSQPPTNNHQPTTTNRPLLCLVELLHVALSGPLILLSWWSNWAYN